MQIFSVETYFERIGKLLLSAFGLIIFFCLGFAEAAEPDGKDPAGETVVGVKVSP